MRLSTYDKPRVIACGTEFVQHIAVRRGCLAATTARPYVLGMLLREAEDFARLTDRQVDNRLTGLEERLGKESLSGFFPQLRPN